MRIELSCTACGNNHFSFPEAGGDRALVTCSDCGHEVGTLGQLKEKVAEMVMGEAWLRDTGSDINDHNRSDDAA